MAFTPFSAKNSKIRLGSAPTTINGTNWEVQTEADEIDVTNFESAGFYVCISGIKKVTVTIEVPVDSTVNLFDLATPVTAGTQLATLKLYWQNTAGPFWDIPLLQVKSVGNTSNVKDASRLRITGTGSATFTYPTGTFIVA